MTVHPCPPAPDAPFALLREMAAVPDLIRGFDTTRTAPWRQLWQTSRQLLISGEGSSRIFPAKNLIARTRQLGLPLSVTTAGAREAAEYPAADDLTIVLSNSGQTREAVALADTHPVQSITAHADTPLTRAAQDSLILRCGPETAVAASKSVIEQALLLHSLAEDLHPPRLAEAADLAQAILIMPLPPGSAEALAAANTAYVAGRNDGVAEEIALKCCEITRIKSLYLEGTYVLHGIEEVMAADDCVILIEPFAAEIDRYQSVLQDGVGLKVIAIASFATPFPTLQIPRCAGFDGYLQLMAAWRLLTAAGQLRGIDIDKTLRARKVGNAVEAGR